MTERLIFFRKALFKALFLIFSDEQQHAFLLLNTPEDDTGETAEEVFVGLLIPEPIPEPRPFPPKRPSIIEEINEGEPLDEDPLEDPLGVEVPGFEGVEVLPSPKISLKIELRSPPDEVLEGEVPVDVGEPVDSPEEVGDSDPPNIAEIKLERKPPLLDVPLDEVPPFVVEGELVLLNNEFNNVESNPPPLVPVLLEEPFVEELVRLLKRSDPISTPTPNKVAKKDLWVELESPPNNSWIKEEREFPLNKDERKLKTEAKRVLIIPLFLIAVNTEDQLMEVKIFSTNPIAYETKDWFPIIEWIISCTNPES